MAESTIKKHPVRLGDNAIDGSINADPSNGKPITITAKTASTNYTLVVHDYGIDLFDGIQGRIVHSLNWDS